MNRYVATYAGLQQLAAAAAVSPLQFNRHGVVATEVSPGGLGGIRLDHLRRNLKHTLGVNAFFAHLALDAAHAGHPLPHWWNEAEAAELFRYNGKRYLVMPDGAGSYSLGDRRIPFLLEYDRGTEGQRDLRKKLTSLAAFYASGAYESYSGDPPIVLVVAERKDAEQEFATAVRTASRVFNIELPVLLTSRWWFDGDFRNPRGTLGPIWHRADSSIRRSWLEEALVLRQWSLGDHRAGSATDQPA